MSAKEQQPGSLTRAHGRISNLMEELNATVEHVDQLTRAGHDAEALIILDEQRDSLYRLVDQISRDVAANAPRRMDTLRRHLTAGLAAAFVAVSTLAVSVGALTRAPDPVADATRQLRLSEDLDPETRLQVIIKVYERTRTLPAAEARKVDQGLVKAADKLREDQDDDGDEDVAKQAGQIAEDLKNGKTPTPPPPQSGDDPPTKPVTDAVPPPP